VEQSPSLVSTDAVPLSGLAGSITTFSSWMLEGYESFADLGGYQRGGLHDVSLEKHKAAAVRQADSF
jgi:hypothetical protein